MKSTLLSGCVLGLTLSLAACGGGGGGGGSGSGSSGYTFSISDMSRGATTRSAPNMANAEETAKALVSPGSDLQSDLTGSGLTVGGWDDYGSSYMLRARANGVILTDSRGDPVATFNSGNMKFYSKDGIDFAVLADVQKPIDMDEIFDGVRLQGSATLKCVGWLGKLDYASFGYWGLVIDNLQVRGDGVSLRGAFLAEELSGIFYDGRAANYVAGLNNSLFTGIAAGMAELYEYSGSEVKGTVIPLLGTAELRITNASNAALTLAFPNFYEFRGSVDIMTAGGHVSGSGGHVSGSFNQVTKLGSALPGNLPTISEFNSGYNYIFGQLYGDTQNNPTEAAGGWRLGYEGTTREIFIGGAWGVKKKP